MLVEEHRRNHLSHFNSNFSESQIHTFLSSVHAPSRPPLGLTSVQTTVGELGMGTVCTCTNVSLRVFPTSWFTLYIRERAVLIILGIAALQHTACSTPIMETAWDKDRYSEQSHTKNSCKDGCFNLKGLYQQELFCMIA